MTSLRNLSEEEGEFLTTAGESQHALGAHITSWSYTCPNRLHVLF